MGSPWEPVHMRTTRSSGRSSTSLMSTRRPSGTVRYPRSRATPMLRTIERPTSATLRPCAAAASSTCCTLCTCEAKLATMMRRLACANTRSSTGAISRSEIVKPGTSALVESTMNRSTPASPSRANARRSVSRPSSGSWSILKSPVCSTVPAEVRTATARASGIEWLTATNSHSNGPNRSTCPSRTASVYGVIRCSFSFASTKARVSWEPTSGRSGRSRSRYGTAPMWSSWPWVRTTATTSCSRSARKEKSGRIRSTPGWLSSGKSTPQSMTSRRPRCSSTAMLRPTSPRPPRATTRRPSSGSGGGGPSSGWGWLIALPRCARSAIRGALCPWFARCARSQDSALGEVEAQLLDLGVRRGHEGQPHRAGGQDALHLQGRLRRDGALGPCHDPAHRREELGVQAAGGGQVPGVHGAHHRRVLPGGDMADDADDAGGAVREPGEVEGVVPAVEGELRLGQDLRPGEEVPGGLLDGHDPGVGRKAQQRGGADPDAGPPGDVVDHHGQVGGVGDGREVRDEPLRRGLAVVGGDDEEAVRARLGRLLRELDGVGGV